MGWQFSVYVVPLSLSIVGSLALCAIAWRYREYRYAHSLFALLIAAMLWSLAYAVGLSVTSLSLKRLVYGVAFLPVGLVSIAWLNFAVRYTGKLRAPTRVELAGLVVVPSLTSVAALTNRHHGLVWSWVETTTVGNAEVMMTSHSALFWVHTVQAYALLGLGTGLIVVTAVSSTDVHESQATSLTVAATFPLLVNLLYLGGFAGPVDLTPAAFSVSGAILIAAAFRDQLLQSLPFAREIARDELVEQMNDAVIVVDSCDRIVDLNPAAASLAGTTADEAIGTDIEAVAPAVADAVGTGRRSEERTELTNDESGAERTYEVESVPLERGPKAVTGRLVTVHDVTEQRQNRQELEREREFIDQALDSLNDVFYVVGADGSLRRWNDRLLQVTGYSAEEVDGMNVVELFPEDDQRRIPDAIEETLTTGRTKTEAEFQTADGERIPYEFTGARLTDPDGDLIGLVGVGRDITERKQRERELRTHKQAVENAGHAIYWTDDEGTIEYVNPAFEEQTGYDATAATGESPAILDANGRTADPWAEAWKTLQDGDPWEGESVNRTRTGQRYIVDQSITPVFDDDTIDRYVAVGTDITERHHREQQLSVLQRVLRHDLRNNLNEVLLATQMLRSELDDSAPTDRLDGIERTVEETLSMGRRIREVRERLADEAGDATTELDLVDRVQTQVTSLRTERQTVDISTDLPSSADVIASEMIDQAIRNVLQNAVDHNDTETPIVRVTLERRQSRGEVVLRIADNGPGIPQDEVSVLESAQEDQLHHLDGVGLWVVTWVVRLAGGDLEFEDNDPRGTVVKMILPVATQDDPLS